MRDNNKVMSSTEVTMAILGVAAIAAGWILGYPLYVLGVALAAPTGWLLHRWQARVVANFKKMPARKANTRLQITFFARLTIHFGALGLSILVGEAFLFGVLTGFLLEVITYMGQAFSAIFKRKEGPLN